MRSIAITATCRFALACALVTAAPAAVASGLQIAPTGLEFAPGGAAQALWLTNTGERELRAQVRTFAWTQRNGEDELEPTRALLASPPMLRIAPGERQLVRVIRAGETAGGVEQAFRLLVDELPAEEPQAGVQYVLRYSVPVFVPGPPASTPAAALQWSNTIAGGSLTLDARNDGSTHARLSGAVLLRADGAPIELVPGLLGYVLAGSRMHWSLKLPAATETVGARLKVQVNGLATEQALPPAPAR